MKQSILLDEHLDRLESQDAQYQRSKSNRQLYLLAGVALFFLALCAGGAFYFFTYYKTSSEPLLGNSNSASTELSLTQQCGRCEINPLISEYEICTLCADKLEDDIALTCQQGHYDIKLLATIVEGKNDATVEANIYHYCQENVEEMSSSCSFNYENDVLTWIEAQKAIVAPFDPEVEEPELEENEEINEEVEEPELQNVRPGMPPFHGKWPSHSHGYPSYPPPKDRFPKNKLFIKYICIETDEEVQEEYLLGAKQQGCAPDKPSEEGTEPDMSTLFCSTGHIDLKAALTSGETTTNYLRCPVDYTNLIVYKAKLGQKNYMGSRSALNSKCGYIDAQSGWEADTGVDAVQMLEGVDSNKCPFEFGSLNFVLEPASDPSNPVLTRRHRHGKHKGMVTINYICTK